VNVVKISSQSLLCTPISNFIRLQWVVLDMQYVGTQGLLPFYVYVLHTRYAFVTKDDRFAWMRAQI